VTVAISMQHISVHAAFLITRGTQISEDSRSLLTPTHFQTVFICIFF